MEGVPGEVEGAGLGILEGEVEGDLEGDLEGETKEEEEEEVGVWKVEGIR